MVVLEGALGKGSSMKLLDRDVVYRQTPHMNKALLYGGVDFLIMCLCCQ